MSMYLFTELIFPNSNYLNYCLSEKGTLKTALTCSMSSVICQKLLSLKVKNKTKQNPNHNYCLPCLQQTVQQAEWWHCCTWVLSPATKSFQKAFPFGSNCIMQLTSPVAEVDATDQELRSSSLDKMQEKNAFNSARKSLGGGI